MCCQQLLTQIDGFELSLKLCAFLNVFSTSKNEFVFFWVAYLFNGPLSGTTRVSRYQKGKTNLDFTEATDSEWQWH